MTTNLGTKQLKKLIKDSVKEAIDFEFIKMRTLFIPFIAVKEQKEIEKTYGKPTRNIARTRNIKI